MIGGSIWTRRLLATVGVLGLVFLTVPIVIVIPMSFSSAKALTFPPPGFSLTSATTAGITCSARAASRTAVASGCFEYCSSPAAAISAAFRSIPGAQSTSVSAGLP